MVKTGTTLVVQWLRLHTPDAGALGWIPAWGTKSYLPQLRVLTPQHAENSVLQLRGSASKAINIFFLMKQNGKNSS